MVARFRRRRSVGVGSWRVGTGGIGSGDSVSVCVHVAHRLREEERRTRTAALVRAFQPLRANPNRWVICGLRKCTANVGARARPLASFIWRVWSGAHNPGKGLTLPIRARLTRSLDQVEINPNRFNINHV